MTHSLPSKPGDPLTTFTAFYKSARLGSDGGADVTLYLPPEMKHEVLELSTNDGMALNITVYETEMPEVDGLGELATYLGIGQAPPAIVPKTKKQ